MAEFHRFGLRILCPCEAGLEHSGKWLLVVSVGPEPCLLRLAKSRKNKTKTGSCVGYSFLFMSHTKGEPRLKAACWNTEEVGNMGSLLMALGTLPTSPYELERLHLMRGGVLHSGLEVVPGGPG